MLIGYGMPTVAAPVLTGTGAAWLTADNGAALFDGKPARRTRLRWLSGAPSTGQALMISAALGEPIRPRIIAVLGLKGVPTGVSVMAAGKRGGDSAHTYVMGGGNTGVTRRMADGSIGCWLVVGEGSDPIVSLAVSLYNSADGSVWATSATEFEIGEIVVFRAVTVGLSESWAIERVDPSSHLRTRGGQIGTVPATSYRRFAGNLAGAPIASVRGGGLANGDDWETVSAALVGGRRCCVIPQCRDIVTRAFDPMLANRSAIYGIATAVPGPQNLQRQYFNGSMTVEEVPP